MGLTIHLIAVLAALIATHTVQGLHFPRGKTLVYKYYADVKAGTIEPAAYASQFSVEGTLYIKHDIRDGTLKNAYYVALRDVKTGMYNGAATYHHHIDVVNPIEDAAKLLEEPFLINYNENGGLQGIRIPASTQGWHKNMKMAMASMLQLDFTKINVKTWEQRQNFISKENTIYGNCSVTYDVFPKGEYPTKEFVIMKFFSPINCTNFYSDSFNHVDVDDCPTHKDDSLNVDSKRVVEIEKDGEEIIIKKLYAHGGVNYLPWNRRSKVHYVLTNATFNLERMAPASEIELPWVDLENAPVVDDLTYQPPTLACMTDAVIDLTQGRHKYHANHAVAELKKLLKEAVDYSEENHLKIGVPNWKHGQIINRIYNKMSCMNERLLEMVYDFYQDSKIPRDIAMKNLFLGIIPQVGTPATFGFVQRMISENKFPEATAIDMLNKLTVRPVPILRMFWMLERLLTFTESVPVAVKKAGILSFSSLLYRTFKDVPHAENDLILHRYLDYFFNQITNGTTYEMKVVHLMAIRNIEIGNIYDVLAPIIKGDLTIAENPMNFRLLAIWAVEKAIVKDYVAADKLLWPIMTDSSLPVKLRIAAYEILINIPNEVLLRRIDWFMIGENNDHFYNYHYTTIRNIASSEEPCKSTLREHIRKIIRFNKKHENTHYTLSASYAYNDYDQFFEFVEKLHGGLVLDDRNGVPEVLRFDGSLVRGPEAVVDVGMRLHIEGLGDILNEKMYSLFVNPERLMNTKVLEVLMEAARDFPPAADIYVDIIMMHNGRVILANHYNRETLSKIYDDVSTYIIIQQQDGLNEYHQSIRYDHLSQKQMINDMGLPVLLESKVPVVAFMKINYKPKITEDLLETAFDWGVELQIWRHGEYTMSTYNPISDAWHAMKRITAIDASLPIYENVTIDFKMKSVKISFPSYVGSKLPIAGIRLYIKDLVTIDADHGNKALKKSCSTCSLHEEVGNDKFRKIKFNTSYDSALSGLKYTLSVLNCELEGQPMMSDLYGTVKPPRDDPWDDWIDEKKIITHQKMKSMLLYPQVGNCGILLKLEPSPQYPPSTINFNLRANMEVDGDDNPWFYRLTPEKYEFIGSAELIPGSANVSVMTFGIKTSVHMNEGHLLNTAKLELSHKMPGERIFKICVNAQKSYPPVPSDPLNRTLSRQETHTIITAASGYLDDDDATCQRESTMLTLTMVGELSDEQKNKFDKDYASGLCTNDMKNPLYENSTEILPLTENCLNEVITYTTLRKYTIIMEHAWLREEDLFVMFNYYENNLRSILSPYLKLNFEIIDPTHVKIIAEVPMQKYATDDKNNHITIEPWLSGFHLTDVKDINDNVVKPLWWAPLDNTRFTYNFLWEYTNSEIKMCSVQPQITMTADYKNFAFTIPQKWTLITGDHGTKLFAIFAKSVGENLATRIYVGNHAIEIMPRPEKSIQLTIDDSDVVLDGKSESRFIRDLYLTIARVTKNKDLVIIEFTQIPSLTMVYSPKQITLTINKFMSKGRVSGLCGHLDGSYYRTNVTEIYTLDDD